MGKKEKGGDLASRTENGSILLTYDTMWQVKEETFRDFVKKGVTGHTTDDDRVSTQEGTRNETHIPNGMDSNEGERHWSVVNYPIPNITHPPHGSGQGTELNPVTSRGLTYRGYLTDSSKPLTQCQIQGRQVGSKRVKECPRQGLSRGTLQRTYVKRQNLRQRVLWFIQGDMN